MRNHNYIIPAILLLFSSSLLAQNEIGIGEWRSHLPYRVFTHLTQSEETLFCATEWSLMMMDKDEMSVDYMSTIDGLSNTGMGVIKYSPSNDVLIVSYSNSVFDLVRGDGSIRTFSEIKTDGNFTDRNIYDIDVDEEGGVIFSCGFGILKFNLDTEEFEYTLDLGFPVNASVLLNNVNYIATEEGVFYAPDDDLLNLQDFSNWTFLDAQEGNYIANVIEAFNGVLYFDINDVLHKYENEVLEEAYPEVSGFSTQYLTTEGKGMVLGLYCGDGCNGKAIYFDENGIATELANNCTNRPQHAIEDNQGRIWMGDNWRGLRLSKTVGGTCDLMEFNSPLSHNSSQIEVSKGKVYVASGGVNSVGNFAGRSDGVFINNNGVWEIINRWTEPYLEDEDAFLDFYKLAIHPENGKAYYGTYWGGLVEQNGDEFKVYNSVNSTLQGATGDEARVISLHHVLFPY